jgi:hypothetical protein
LGAGGGGGGSAGSATTVPAPGSAREPKGTRAVLFRLGFAIHCHPLQTCKIDKTNIR